MKKIYRWLLKIFNRTKLFLDKYMKPSVKLVENIQIVMSSPVVDIITAIIPGELDDYIKNRMRAYLPLILQQLRITEKCIGLTDPNEIVKCALEALKLYDEKAQWVQLKGIAVMMTDALADGKLDWEEIEAMAIFAHNQISKNP